MTRVLRALALLLLAGVTMYLATVLAGFVLVRLVDSVVGTDDSSDRLLVRVLVYGAAVLVGGYFGIRAALRGC